MTEAAPSPILDQVELLQSSAASWERQLHRTQTRAAEVAANPEAQAWEVERSRDSLATAQRAVDHHAALLAVARL